MSSPSPTTIDGDRLREMFSAAAGHLESVASAIDAINVYPVPDGDTGSNMSATLREAVRAADQLDPGAQAGDVLAAIARAALYGARGNSGVILSQALRGFAEPSAGHDQISGRGLVSSLESACQRAYRAVAEPREGTMLTVLRVAAEEAARALSEQPLSPPADVLAVAVGAAEAAEAATIDQLPQLREAGVTDSGGEGICAIFRALYSSLIGAPLPVAANVPAAAPDLHGIAHEGYGHCTEFLIERIADPVNVDLVRDWLVAQSYQSVVVIGDDDLARVHVHALDPKPVIAGAARYGRVRRVKVDDMDVQAGRFAESGSGATAKVALLALSPGEGFDGIFHGLGAHVMRLKIVKPAAGEIARAADALGIPDVILLPDHDNVIWAAGQAVDLASCTLHVVPATTVPQGIAAALTFDEADPVDHLTARMADALGTVRTVEVTRAAASRTVEGVSVREGQWIVLLDTKMVAGADAALDALIIGLKVANAANTELVTVYLGEGQREHAEQILKAVSTAFPIPSVEMLDGGQPLYAFIASVE
jgi:uncharacterized protein